MAEREHSPTHALPRVAFLTGGLGIGGTTTLQRYVLQALRQKGAPVHIFCFAWKHPMKEEFERDGIPITRVDDQKFIYEDIKSSLYSELRKFRPDAVFAVLGPPAFDLLRHVPAGVLRVGTIHDHYKVVYDVLQAHADCMDAVAAGSKITEEHTRKLLPNIPCDYLPYGIRFESDFPRRSPNPDQPLRLLFFGRFDEAQKGISMFPRIAAELERRGVPYQWTFHGQGSDEPLLTEPLAPLVQQGKVRFSKPVNHGDLAAIIAAHDVYMLASTHETGPLTLLEGMKGGLVPVCGNIPCLVDEVIQDGRNGFLVPQDDPKAYVDAILRLHEDRPLLETLSAAAREIAETQYSADAMADRYLGFIKRYQSPGGGQAAEWPEKIDGGSRLLEGPRYAPALRPVRRLIKRIKAKTL